MKRRFFLLLIATVIVASSAMGVTRQEMEQARTITAQQFLRYMNNGSGYLDELNPVRVSDLKKNLKAKELENLKTFESIAYPKIDEYSKWSKDDLIQFWGTEFFADSRVPAEAKGARSRVKAKIGAMSVAEASTIAETPTNNVEETPSLEEADNAAAEAQRMLDSIKMADSIAAEARILAASSEAQDETFDTVAANAESFDEPIDEASKSKSSPTLLYIIILVVLIAVVVALVIYAVRSMKSGNVNSETEEIEKEDAADRSAEIALYERIIADKDAEIQSLKDEVERLNAMLHNSHQSQPSESTVADNVAPMPPIRPSRTIYLAYANAKGMFVRADSRYNEEYSIFKLVTTDGVTGSFSIVDEPAAQKLAMSLPISVLSNTCISDDMQHGNWSRHIVTEREGTAVFENGRWMVMRKTEINFE